MSSPTTIAVVRLSALGDVALCYPILSYMNEHYPQVRVLLITKTFHKPIFADLPNVLLISFEKKYDGLLGLLRLTIYLKKQNVDTIADLHDVLRTKAIRVFAPLVGIPTRHIDKQRGAKRRLLRRGWRRSTAVRPVIEQYADVLRKIGYSIPYQYLAEPKPKAKPDVCISWFNSENIFISKEKNERWVGIAPFSKHSSKEYPLEQMHEVIERLLKKNSFTIRVFIFCAKPERERIHGWVGERVYFMPSEFSFEKELMMISTMDAMLSMDSANAHLASLYRVPTLTLWGSTHPSAGFAPYMQPPEYAITNDDPNKPFAIYGKVNKRQKLGQVADYFEGISPDGIVDALLAVLSPAAGGRNTSA